MVDMGGVESGKDAVAAGTGTDIGCPDVAWVIVLVGKEVERVVAVVVADLLFGAGWTA